jgi:2-keto-4-pentenoate hydratase/2-oxohepta-3-ene-1,7-dioic acid hydratase in catechol pathway
MLAFLKNGARAMENARLVQELYKHHEFHHNQGLEGAQLWFKHTDIRLEAPIMNPPAYRDFLAFETHTKNGFARRNEEIPAPWYELPIYYKGNHRTLVGHDHPIEWPAYSNKLDYELEIACVIGKAGRDIPAESARHHIAGYMILNDFSARDIQAKEMQCRLGPAKGKDFASAIGPWLVTPDEVGDPRNLTMKAFVNGELWSEGNSGTAHWTFEQMIAHVSQSEMIYPGDILGSGTVGFGCGLELNRFLNTDDTVTLEIEKLGSLTNQVVKMLPALAH